MKILLFDIENAPMLGYFWRRYEADIIKVIEESYILCVGYKWLGEKTEVISLQDYRGTKESREKKMLLDLKKKMNEADLIIGQNGDNFDIKICNARMIFHDIEPPAPYKTIDTLKVARKYFKFSSNKLDDLGEYLGVGRKVKHKGIDLWFECMDNEKEAWKDMIKYNKQDVDLLERVYLKMRPWINPHPNVNVLEEKLSNCPKCGDSHIQKRGFGIVGINKRQKYQCMNCGGWSSGGLIRTGIKIK